jgi:hypothetical protein
VGSKGSRVELINVEVERRGGKMQAHLHQASTHHTAAVPIRGTSTHLLRLLVQVSLQLIHLTLLHLLLTQHVVNAARLRKAQRGGWAGGWMSGLVAALL